ncbi:unnamed protein product [Rangifer tarandus platyrhynchus]|uniref:Uncharacterized protein n=2 Tax=Rangifer tarandus platyrhynchus TaxID=3082113 RepID=A0ABN8ZQJ3_RANTA|nr:unnamed protein product [Rangifer tarandus platyrhynchus]
MSPEPSRRCTHCSRPHSSSADPAGVLCVTESAMCLPQVGVGPSPGHPQARPGLSTLSLEPLLPPAPRLSPWSLAMLSVHLSFPICVQARRPNLTINGNISRGPQTTAKQLGG